MEAIRLIRKIFITTLTSFATTFGIFEGLAYFELVDFRTILPNWLVWSILGAIIILANVISFIRVGGDAPSVAQGDDVGEVVADSAGDFVTGVAAATVVLGVAYLIFKRRD